MQRPRENSPVCPGIETSPEVHASSARARSPPAGNWTQSSPPVKVLAEMQKPSSSPPPAGTAAGAAPALAELLHRGAGVQVPPVICSQDVRRPAHVLPPPVAAIAATFSPEAVAYSHSPAKSASS